VQKTICCNQTSNARDDGRMYPKYVELRIHQQNYLLASRWHFILFHEEDARSNNPQIQLTLPSLRQHNLFILKQGYMFRQKVSHLQALTTFLLPDALPLVTKML